MFAPRHSLFIGPGKLPDELRQVLAKRAGSLQPDIAIQVPRLLAIFESAAEAERIASQVQRLKLGVAVAGPEQPPAELSWTVAMSLDFADKLWRVVTLTGEAQAFRLEDVLAITLLDWRPEEGAADRATLVTLRDGRPVLLRASRIDTVSRSSVPMLGITRINEFLDAAALVLPPEARVRSRRLTEAEFRGPAGELTGDLLPLVLAVVDGVDSIPGELPQPLRARPAPPVSTGHLTGLASVSAWTLYLLSLPTLVLSLAYLTIAAMSFGVVAACIGLTLGAWATRRFMWSRWLAKENWSDRSPIPPWPIAAGELGIKPRPLELPLDALALVAICVGALGEGLVRAISLAALPGVLLGVLISAASVYEAWQRE